MKIASFRPTLDAEARLLILIEAFSRGSKVLEGRTKLAKLDFLLRYPSYFARAFQVRRPALSIDMDLSAVQDIETRMVRYRYGPWDPAYYALLGRLIGKGLIEPIPFTRGVGYRVTSLGRGLATRIGEEPMWECTSDRVELLRKHFNLSGTSLKNFIYENFPEVTQSQWGEILWALLTYKWVISPTDFIIHP